MSITVKTVKLFIDQNIYTKLYIKILSKKIHKKWVDLESDFERAKKKPFCNYQLGVSTLWLDNSPNDKFEKYDDGEWAGIKISNKMQETILAIKRSEDIDVDRQLHILGIR